MPTLFKYFKHSGPAAEDSKVLPKPDGPLVSLVPFYNFCRQKISRMITSAKFIFAKSLQWNDSRNFLSAKISSYTVYITVGYAASKQLRVICSPHAWSACTGSFLRKVTKYVCAVFISITNIIAQYTLYCMYTLCILYIY